MAVDKIRPELDQENSRKVMEWERVLRERHGISMSPNRMINLLVENIDYFEIEQVFRIAIKNTEADRSDPKRKKSRLIIRTTLGKTHL